MYKKILILSICLSVCLLGCSKSDDIQTGDVGDIQLLTPNKVVEESNMEYIKDYSDLKKYEASESQDIVEDNSALNEGTVVNKNDIVFDDSLMSDDTKDVESTADVEITSSTIESDSDIIEVDYDTLEEHLYGTYNGLNYEVLKDGSVLIDGVESSLHFNKSSYSVSCSGLPGGTEFEIMSLITDKCSELSYHIPYIADVEFTGTTDKSKVIAGTMDLNENPDFYRPIKSIEEEFNYNVPGIKVCGTPFNIMETSIGSIIQSLHVSTDFSEDYIAPYHKVTINFEDIGVSISGYNLSDTFVRLNNVPVYRLSFDDSVGYIDIDGKLEDAYKIENKHGDRFSAGIHDYEGAKVFSIKLELSDKYAIDYTKRVYGDYNAERFTNDTVLTPYSIKSSGKVYDLNKLFYGYGFAEGHEDMPELEIDVREGYKYKYYSIGAVPSYDGATECSIWYSSHALKSGSYNCYNLIPDEVFISVVPGYYDIQYLDYFNSDMTEEQLNTNDSRLNESARYIPDTSVLCEYVAYDEEDNECTISLTLYSGRNNNTALREYCTFSMDK